MANELNYYGLLAQTGLTIVAKVYTAAGVQVGDDIACAEAGALGIYTGDMPTAVNGVYGVRFIDSDGNLVGQGEIDWDGTKERRPLDVDLTGIATAANVADAQTAIETAIANKAVTPVTDISSLATQASINALNNLSASDVTAAVPSTAQIEAALINEGDGQQLVDAMVQAIGNTNVDEVALVAAIRADLERMGGRLDLTATQSLADTYQTVLVANHTSTRTLINTRSDTIDTSLSTIVADTDELQQNQGGLSESELHTALDNYTNKDNWKATGFSTHSAADVWAVATRTLSESAGVTAQNIADIATAVEQAILNEGDGTQVLNAIVGAIGNTNVDQVALVAAIRSDLERSGGSIALLETKAQADARQTALVAEHDATQTAIGNITSITPAEVNEQVDIALADYDAPTLSELQAESKSIVTQLTGTTTSSSTFVADTTPTTFEEWLTRLEPYLLLAPQPVIEQRLIEAAIEACEDASIWVVQLDEIAVVAGTQTYELPTLVNSQIHSIQSVQVNGKYLHSENGDFYVNERGQITLRTSPKYSSDPITQAEPRRKGLIITTSLKPTQTSLTLAGILWRDYQKMIHAGALSKCFAMPNRAWSDEEQAAKYRNIFEEEMADARRAIDRGFVTGDQRLERQFFAAPTNNGFGGYNSPSYRGQV